MTVSKENPAASAASSSGVASAKQPKSNAAWTMDAHPDAKLRPIKRKRSRAFLVRSQLLAACDKILEKAAEQRPLQADAAVSTLPWRVSAQLRGSAEASFGSHGGFKRAVVIGFLSFVVLLLLLLLSASLFVTDDLRAESAKRVSKESNATITPAPLGSRLPVCDMRWGANRTLTIIDMALLTSLTYAYDNFDIDFDTWFRKADPQGGWVAVTRQNSSDLVSEFVSFESAFHGVSIVGIRGTTTGKDALADLDIWGEATALRAMLAIVPGASFMADDVAAWFTASLAGTANLLRSPSAAGGIREYWARPAQYVADRLRRSEQTGTLPETIVVGHSLGGGVAKIVSAMTGAHAVAFEPPGTLYARAKFGITRPDLFARTFTFALDRDPVASQSDKQAAGIQWAHCPDGVLAPAACHSLRGIASMLLSNCGDRIEPSRAVVADAAWEDGVQQSVSPPQRQFYN